MFGIDREVVKELREAFPVGCRVRLVRMNDPFRSRPDVGDLGTVRAVDDVGTIHVSWDCGSSLGVVYGEDMCVRVGT